MKDLEKVLYILSLSNIHKTWTVSDIQRLIIPPLKLDQYRIYEDETTPLCFVSWAFFDSETSKGYLNKTRKIQPEDWNTGGLLWLIDVICPYGGTMEAMLRLDQERKEYNKGNVSLGGRPKTPVELKTVFYRRLKLKQSLNAGQEIKERYGFSRRI